LTRQAKQGDTNAIGHLVSSRHFCRLIASSNAMTRVSVQQRPSQIAGVANICAVIAAFAFILVAEWIPGLLPYSPNLALAPHPSALRSVGFPIAAFVVGVLGLASWVFLRRLHSAAPKVFVGFWLTMVAGGIILCWMTQHSLTLLQGVFFVLVLVAGFWMWQTVTRHWPIHGGRSANRLERS
jgi:hypothetical protein